MIENETKFLVDQLEGFNFKISKLSKEQALSVLKYLENNERYSFDNDTSHVIADKVLLCLINDKEIEDAYEEIEKWYS